MESTSSLEEYERHLMTVIRVYPSGWRTWMDLAMVQQKQSKIDDALRTYDRLLELNPEYTDAWTSKALLLNMRRYYQAAECAAQMAINIDPNDPFAWNEKGFALEFMGDVDAATECFDKLIRIRPAMGWARKGCLKVFDKGECVEAVECFEKCLRLSPNHVAAWNGKAAVHFMFGQYADCMDCCEKALKVAVIDLPVLQIKGVVLLFQEKLEEAEQVLRGIFQKDRGFTGTYICMGYIHVLKKDYAEAIQWFDRAIASKTFVPAALQGKLLIEYLSNEANRPEECPNLPAKTLMELNIFQNCLLFMYRGKVLKIFGFLEEAKNAFRKCLTINPKFEAANVELSKCGT